ncbi:hypothetical protein [Actinocatenispora thailandica]|nr:hypothetical protein [Actinocatenispora thailandica]
MPPPYPGAPDPGLPPYSPGYDPGAAEPGTFYEQPGGPASGVPYDQPGMPASGQPYGPGMPPPDPGSPYGPPTSAWGQPAPIPTTSSKLSGGAIAGIVGGACALLLVVVLGLVFLVHTGNEANRKAAEARASASSAAEDSAEPSDSESPSPSESVSPTDEYRDPADLDDEDTDPVPFELDSIFPETAAGITLDSEGFFSACSDAGDSNTEALLRKHDCGNMATADYPDPSKKLLASAMVIPLPTADDADAVEKGLDGQSSAFNGLKYFCPKSGASSHLCDDGATPRWRAYYGAYHRYMIIVTVLRYDGALPSNKKADSTGNGVFNAIEDTLLGE